MSRTSEDSVRRFKWDEYNIVFEWSPSPRWRVPELGITVSVGRTKDLTFSPSEMLSCFQRTTELLKARLKSFKRTEDHPLPLRSLIDQMVMADTEVTIPVAAKLLGGSPQTIRRAIDRGDLAGRKTPGGKRFVKLRTVAEARVKLYGGGHGRAAIEGGPVSTNAGETPLRAGDFARLIGLSRSKFYRVIEGLVALGVITPLLSAGRQRKYLASDVHKVRATLTARFE